MTESAQSDGDGLSAAAKAALAALRAEDAMPDEAHARVWDRLAANTGADLADRTGRRRVGLVVLGLALAAGLVLAVAGVRQAAVPVASGPTAPAAQYGGQRAGSQVAVPRVPAEPAAAPVEIEAAVVPVPEDRSVKPGRKRSAAVVAAPIVEAGPVAAGPALAREAALLQQAQAALAGARPDQALEHLDSYDREFAARGVLRPERDGLRAVALCAAGRALEGRAAAAAFLRAHAGSVHADRVRGACGEKD